jgi:plastocyanin domain-containing protein
MVRVLMLSLSLFVSVACKKDEPKRLAPQAELMGSVAKPGVIVNGVRHIEIEANAEGYTPGRIPGKPGEKLVLVFTRTIDAQCIAQLKTPDGKLVDLPKGQPVEVAVTVPQTGEVGFACGMDMFHGVVVAQPTS